ncbi:MAG: DUF420 domain-containing protein [Planctomycetota bacterium]|jgi:uncharacterized membrane protein YozB (DUF420 family)|nr:DUF420 domain-containing protein [Planctomycetota bacterium]
MLATVYSKLPDLNAALNALTLTLIVCGIVAIKRGRETAHKRCMLAAVCVSVLFLTSYLIYHFTAAPVKFQKQGAIRSVYFTILISHTILAVVQLPLIIVTVIRGLKDQREKHRRIAKITAVIWSYVSLTGIIVYLMLYRM